MFKDTLKGGKADKKKPEDFPKDKLEEGMKHEIEHTDDKNKAMEIAMDHLTEDIDYYSKLKGIEKKSNFFKDWFIDELKKVEATFPEGTFDKYHKLKKANLETEFGKEKEHRALNKTANATAEAAKETIGVIDKSKHFISGLAEKYVNHKNLRRIHYLDEKVGLGLDSSFYENPENVKSFLSNIKKDPSSYKNVDKYLNQKIEQKLSKKLAEKDSFYKDNHSDPNNQYYMHPKDYIKDNQKYHQSMIASLDPEQHDFKDLFNEHTNKSNDLAGVLRSEDRTKNSELNSLLRKSTISTYQPELIAAGIGATGIAGKLAYNALKNKKKPIAQAVTEVLHESPKVEEMAKKSKTKEILDSASEKANNANDWIKENPGKAIGFTALPIMAGLTTAHLLNKKKKDEY